MRSFFGRQKKIQVSSIVKDEDVTENDSKSISIEEEDDNESYDFMCPISYQLMEDPVIASDGVNYERSQITEWLQNHNTSPITNLPLDSKELKSNVLLKNAISDYKKTIEQLNNANLSAIHKSFFKKMSLEKTKFELKVEEKYITDQFNIQKLRFELKQTQGDFQSAQKEWKDSLMIFQKTISTKDAIFEKTIKEKDELIQDLRKMLLTTMITIDELKKNNEDIRRFLEERKVGEYKTAEYKVAEHTAGKHNVLENQQIVSTERKESPSLPFFSGMQHENNSLNLSRVGSEEQRQQQLPPAIDSPAVVRSRCC